MSEPKTLKLNGPLFIANIKDDATLVEFSKQLDVIREEEATGLKSLKEQAKNLKESSELKAKSVWESITTHLQTSGLLPEGYDNDKHGLQITGNEQLFVEQQEEACDHGLSDLFRAMQQAGAKSPEAPAPQDMN